MALSRAEEADLTRRAKAGEAEAARLLVAAVTPFVWRVTNALCLRYPMLDPMESVSLGLEAVARCLEHFDPATGKRWMTYAGAAAKNACWRAVRDARTRARHFPLALPPTEDPDPDAIPREQLPETTPLIDLVRDALSRLDPLSRKVVEATFGIDHPRWRVHRISRHYGISCARVRRKLAEALETLRKCSGIQLEERA